jgi:hypothetical protein
MAKAFDTLSHDFLGKVYSFYNFGPSIKKWLALLGNRRQACILLDEGKSSTFFPLNCGRPQGDNISPNTFNFSNQILIFKIELDKNIAKIPRHLPLQFINNVENVFAKESNRETDKNESLADDNTTITLLEQTSLSTVKNILNEFETISGLACNFNKSCVIPTIEPDEADTALIRNLGFQVDDRFKLLGVEISRDLNTAASTYNNIKEKILNQIPYWERFKLSLPGRTSIAKTFLVSQLNYVGCFLPAPAETIEQIQVLIDGFVKKNCIISRDRLHRDPERGGVGMLGMYVGEIFLKHRNAHG